MPPDNEVLKIFPDKENTNNGIILSETRANLTAQRAHESNINFMDGNTAYTEIEKAYGKYLFVPYAIPKIELNDIEKFLTFFYSNAKYAGKEVNDFADGKIDSSKKVYQTVDSMSPNWKSVWSKNPRPQIYKEFSELFEQIHDYMPWVGPATFQWNIWSSNRNIIPHRDYCSCVDLPHAMRIKLWDSNPEETLRLVIDPVEISHDNSYVTLPKLKETNTFGWNNLRTKHDSIYNSQAENTDGTFIPKYRKVLFIWRDVLKTQQQVNQFVDMLDKSIDLYKNTESLWIDTNDVSKYLNL